MVGYVSPPPPVDDIADSPDGDVKVGGNDFERDAITTHLANDGDVFFTKLRVRALASPQDSMTIAPLGHHVVDVVGLCSQKQVVHPYTCRGVATVKDKQL